MKNGMYIAAGLALLGLVAFKGAEDNGPVRYSVIHTEGNTVMVFDTTVTDAEAYTVEDFLADHGLDATQAEIFNLDELNNTEIRTLNNNVWFMNSDLPSGDHEATEIRIEKTMNSEGEEEVHKWVNGEEVEWDGEEYPAGSEVIIEQIVGPSNHQVFKFEGDSTVFSEQHMKVIVVDDEDVDMGEFEFEMTEMNVEVETTIDENGNEVTHVFINGEEVDPSELEELEMNQSGENVVIELITEQEEIMHEGGENVFVYEVVTNEQELSGMSQTFVFVSSEQNDSQAEEKRIDLEQSESIQNIRFMPNPNDGVFNLSFELLERKRTQIQIVDMSGKLVYTEDLGKFSGEYNKQINISAEGPGTYILSVQQGKERIAEKVIVR